jgi:hypothetical protein
MDDNAPDPLDKLLARWQVSEELPPDFPREVWRRIAARQGAESWLDHLAWWLLRPKREAILVVTAVLLAVLWGVTHPPEARFGARDAYLMSVSPFDPQHLKSLSR